jgi:hypothetical protein
LWIADHCRGRQGRDDDPCAVSKLRHFGDMPLTVATPDNRTRAVASKNVGLQWQAAGWKVVRLSTVMPDATTGYLIHPVVASSDYSIVRILDDAFPDERQALADLYRGAFARSLSLATGS